MPQSNAILLESWCHSLLLFFFLCQALYFCVPFREKLLEYYEKNKNPADPEENLLTCLADLFTQVKDRIIITVH